MFDHEMMFSVIKYSLIHEVRLAGIIRMIISYVIIPLTFIAEGYLLEQFMGNKFQHYGYGYLEFIITGMIFSSFINISIYDVPTILREEQTFGNFDYLLTTPTSIQRWLIARMIQRMIFILPNFVIMIVVLHAVGVPFAFSKLIGALIVLLMMFFLSILVGYAYSATIMKLKDTFTISSIFSTLFQLLSGIFFPPQVLPERFILLFWLNPFYQLLDIFRKLMFLKEMDYPHVLLLAFVMGVLLIIFLWLFEKSIAKSKVRGDTAV